MPSARCSAAHCQHPSSRPLFPSTSAWSSCIPPPCSLHPPPAPRWLQPVRWARRIWELGAAAGLGSLLLKLVFPSCVPPPRGARGSPAVGLRASIAIPLLYASCSSGFAIPAVGTARLHRALGGSRACAVKRGGPGAEAKSLETHQRLSRPRNAGARGGMGPCVAVGSPARGVGAVGGEGGNRGGRAGTASRCAGKEPISKEPSEKMKHHSVALHIYFCRRGGWESRREMPAEVVYF